MRTYRRVYTRCVPRLAASQEGDGRPQDPPQTPFCMFSFVSQKYVLRNKHIKLNFL